MPELEKFKNYKIMEQLIRLCFELQKFAEPDDCWFIPTNKAQELFGITPQWLARLLKKLCRENIIKLVKKHTKHRCTRYIYIGPSIKLFNINMSD